MNNPGIGKAMCHALMAYNFLKRRITNLLTGPRIHPIHVMAEDYFMVSTLISIISYVLSN